MQYFKHSLLLLIKRKNISMNIDIDACKQGEQEALGDLYKAYSNRLMRICRHYVTDESVAEDILHDAFIIIFTSIKTLKDNSKVEGWMITIVRNLTLRYLQSAGKAEIPLSYLTIEPADIDGEEKKSIELQMLLSALESLPEGYREVFKLSVLDGLSHKEIGAMLGINAHSSSSQLSRAKKMLRELLANYWALFLLPVLIPVYIYFATRDRNIGTSNNKSTALTSQKRQTKRVQCKAEKARKGKSKYSEPLNSKGYYGSVPTVPTVSEEKLTSQIRTDSIVPEKVTVPSCVDSLHKYMTKGFTIEDSLHDLPQVPQGKLMVLGGDNNFKTRHKKKYPWTFNFGYSSNAEANGSIPNLNYLSVIDYANGGATAKLYTWSDLEEYYARNNSLMDSVERARMSLMLREHSTDGNSPLGEVANHDRPRTFSLSINKQLNSRWTFGTGITYTRLKSEFKSEHGNTKLQKTQKIDYVGVPLRLTYRVWGKGRFNAYTTGGVTFEMPVHNSLEKNYIITSDSSFMLREHIKTRQQWSVNLGVGVQYKVFKPFSLYIEPNMFYYFGNGSGLETYRTEHPFIITVPFGLRLTW